MSEKLLENPMFAFFVELWFVIRNKYILATQNKTTESMVKQNRFFRKVSNIYVWDYIYIFNGTLRAYLISFQMIVPLAQIFIKLSLIKYMQN